MCPIIVVVLAITLGILVFYTVGIVPIDGQTTIFTSCPIDGDMVGLLKGLDEMQGIIVAKVLDAEIIDCKGERGRE